MGERGSRRELETLPHDALLPAIRGPADADGDVPVAQPALGVARERVRADGGFAARRRRGRHGAGAYHRDEPLADDRSREPSLRSRASGRRELDQRRRPRSRGRQVLAAPGPARLLRGERGPRPRADRRGAPVRRDAREAIRGGAGRFYRARGGFRHGGVFGVPRDVARARADGEGATAAVSVERFSGEELLTRIAETRLRGFDGAKPYADAALSLVSMSPDDLAPAQRYVLRPTVQEIVSLRDELLAHGLDMFALDGGAYVRGVPVIPPIVEESHEPDGRTVWLINDGIHRVYAARSLGLPITVVRATDVSHPYYALALPGGWSEVEELNELPERYEKKTYRDPSNYKALFREFNEVFPGVQERRRKSNPEHLRA